MKSLADKINNNDVFAQDVTVDEAIIQEYHERSQRKNSDDKWLKQHKPLVVKGLEQLGKQKADFGEYRASVTVPDQSNFNPDLVIEFLKNKGLYEVATKRVLDEEILMKLIEDEKIDAEELQEYAWETKQGTPRLTIKQVVKF